MPSLAQPFGAAALCAAAIIIASVPISVAPANALARQVVLSRPGAKLLEPEQYRGQYDGRRSNRYEGRGYRGNDIRYVALGIGGLIIGGIILSEAARSRHRRDHSNDWQRCTATYRSFETDTGMYTGYDGIRRPCPYLR